MTHMKCATFVFSFKFIVWQHFSAICSLYLSFQALNTMEIIAKVRLEKLKIAHVGMKLGVLHV